jgi:phosphotriesterase-related protein
MDIRRETSALSRRGLLGLGIGALSSCGEAKSILVHEHILVDFAGAAVVSRSRYVHDEVIAAAKPKLDAIVKLGCVRLLECTPNFLGRDPVLLDKLSQACGIEIWTNTGLYAANRYRHIPEYVKTETSAQLAQRWIAEWRNGIEGTKPRFIKIGVNDGPLGEWDKKLVEAAAIASLETGLTIASHTGRGAALEQVEILTKLRLPLKKFVWVHAQNEKDHKVHAEVARAGAWVEFDGIHAKSIAWHKECVEFMAGAGLLGRVLVSQDSGWWHVGEPAGGTYNGYDAIYQQFLPQIDRKLWRQLLWENPREAFGN